MRLDKNIWTIFRTYLLFDRKQSDKRSAISANKSRFTILASYFEHVDFNRQTFTDFLLRLKEKGYSISYMNNFIKMAKTIDRYYRLNEVSDYTYFPEIRSVPLEIVTPEEIEALATVQIPYKKMNSYINQRQQALILLLGTAFILVSSTFTMTSWTVSCWVVTELIWKTSSSVCLNIETFLFSLAALDYTPFSVRLRHQLKNYVPYRSYRPRIRLDRLLAIKNGHRRNCVRGPSILKSQSKEPTSERK